MIENVKVFVADIDGTMRDKGDDLPERNREALEEMHKRGILIGLASGRSFDHRLCDNAKNWNLSFDFDFVIASNGAELWVKEHPDTHETFYKLTLEETARCMKSLYHYGFNPLNYYHGYDLLFAREMDDFLQLSMFRNGTVIEYKTLEEMCQYQAVKVEVHYKEDMEEAMQQVCKEVVYGDVINVVTHANTMEFMNYHVNKGMCLKKYCDARGIDLSEVIAFGDMDNDIEMVKVAGWGVSLKDGCDALKAVAQDVTVLDCNAGGVGDYLFTHILK